MEINTVLVTGIAVWFTVI